MNVKFVLAVLATMLMAVSGNAFALRCVDASNNNVHINDVISSNVAVPADEPNGAVIWESNTYNITARCSHDAQLITEGVYLYLNPESMTVGQGTQVGIRWNGTVYTQASGRIPLNQTISSSQDSVTFPFAFSVVVMKMGATPPSGYANFNRYAVFQMDGVGGLNSTPDSNLDFRISGNVRFIGCRAALSFSPSDTVDFGSIAANGDVGSEAARREITVTALRECQSPYSIRVSFTPSKTLSDPYTMAFGNGLGVGLVDKASGAAVALTGAKTNFVSLVNSNTDSKTYVARLTRLVTKVNTGPFNGALVLNLEYY